MNLKGGAIKVKKKAIFLNAKPENMNRVYSEEAVKELRGMVDLHEVCISKCEIISNREVLSNAELAFSTWGMPDFTENEIMEYMPNLKVVFYGAGSVQRFARPFLNCGVNVVSAWVANAVPVAEYAASQIVLANKGFYINTILCKKNRTEARKLFSKFPGNYSVKVGIIGAGMIGRMVINLLKQYNVDIMVFDPFLADDKASELGVTKHSLTEIFATCQTISNHLANNPQTVGIMNEEHFNLMLDNATFINTGRGAQVVEEDLIEALKAVPTRTAVLDVTYPEPVREDSEFLKMDNVFLTSHIAGSSGNEVHRMAWYMIDEFKRYEKGEELLYNVTPKMLETMA